MFGSDGVLYHVAARPATALLAAALFAVWVALFVTDAAVESVAFRYDLVVADGEWWRLLTSTFAHFAFLHLAFNVSSLWSSGAFEAAYGSALYLRNTLLLMCLSWAALLLLHRFATRWYTRETNAYAVGFSGVAFGWLAMWSVVGPTWIELISGFRVPAALAPWVTLGLTHVMVQHASLLGHTAGIVAGYLVGLGAFAWLDDWALATATIWALWRFLFSWAESRGAALSCTLRRTTDWDITPLARQPG